MTAVVDQAQVAAEPARPQGLGSVTPLRPRPVPAETPAELLTAPPLSVTPRWDLTGRPVPEQRRRRRRKQPVADVAGTPWAAERRTDEPLWSRGTAPPSDPGRVALAVVQSAIEVLRGLRPLVQLTGWLSPDVFDTVGAAALRMSSGQPVTPPPQRSTRVRACVEEDDEAPGYLAASLLAELAGSTVRRAHLCRIGPGVAEASVLVSDRERTRVVAVRLEARHGRWRTTVLEPV